MTVIIRLSDNIHLADSLKNKNKSKATSSEQNNLKQNHQEEKTVCACWGGLQVSLWHMRKRPK